MRRRSFDAGFSLLEVLIAAGLLTTVLAALAPLVVAAVRSDLQSRLRSVAMVAAQQKQEELLWPVTGVPAPSEGTDRVDLAGHETSADAGDAAFVRRWRTSPLAADPAAAVVIRVEVTSPLLAGRAVVGLTTIRRRHGP